MKKIFALALVFSIIFAPSIYAETTSDNIDISIKSNELKLTPSEKRQVSHDEILFKEMSIDTNLISVNKVESTNSITYKLDYGDGIIETATIEQLSSGDIRMEVSSENSHDIIVQKTDGTITIDGNPVTVEERDVIQDGTELNSSNTDISVQSQYGRGSTYKTSPYKGSASDYTKKVKVIKTASVKASKRIRRMTITAISIILKNSIQTLVPTTLPVSVLTKVAKEIKPVAKRNAPKSEYLSYSLTKYAYKNNGKLDKYYKYAGSYYAEKKYAGKKVSHTFYEYNAIGL